IESGGSISLGTGANAATLSVLLGGGYSPTLADMLGIIDNQNATGGPPGTVLKPAPQSTNSAPSGLDAAGAPRPSPTTLPPGAAPRRGGPLARRRQRRGDLLHARARAGPRAAAPRRRRRRRRLRPAVPSACPRPGRLSGAVVPTSRLTGAGLAGARPVAHRNR